MGDPGMKFVGQKVRHFMANKNSTMFLSADVDNVRAAVSPFTPLTTDVICTMVKHATNKYSMKDAMPTSQLRTSIDLLAPYITSLFNLSLSSGIVPTCSKDAYVISWRISRLKKRCFLVESFFRVIDRYRT